MEAARAERRESLERGSFREVTGYDSNLVAVSNLKTDGNSNKIQADMTVDNWIQSQLLGVRTLELTTNVRR